MKKLLKSLIATIILITLIAGCNQPVKGNVPSVDVNAIGTAVAATSEVVKQQAAMTVQAMQARQTPVVATGATPVGTPANPAPVNCTVRTFVKKGAEMREEKDVYVVLGKWADGHATFQTARVCEYYVTKGLASFDVIWDQDASNISVVFPATFTFEEVKAIGSALGFSRVAAIQTHPSGRACIDYDMAAVNPAFGQVQYYQGYDRKDWSANPLYHCPEMSLPTATPLPR